MHSIDCSTTKFYGYITNICEYVFMFIDCCTNLTYIQKLIPDYLSLRSMHLYLHFKLLTAIILDPPSTSTLLPAVVTSGVLSAMYRTCMSFELLLPLLQFPNLNLYALLMETIR